MGERKPFHEVFVDFANGVHDERLGALNVCNTCSQCLIAMFVEHGIIPDEEQDVVIDTMIMYAQESMDDDSNQAFASMFVSWEAADKVDAAIKTLEEDTDGRKALERIKVEMDKIAPPAAEPVAEEPADDGDPTEVVEVAKTGAEPDETGTGEKSPKAQLADDGTRDHG
jgi:hypothetical protein